MEGHALRWGRCWTTWGAPPQGQRKRRRANPGDRRGLAARPGGPAASDGEGERAAPDLELARAKYGRASTSMGGTPQAWSTASATDITLDRLADIHSARWIARASLYRKADLDFGILRKDSHLKAQQRARAAAVYRSQIQLARRPLPWPPRSAPSSARSCTTSTALRAPSRACSQPPPTGMPARRSSGGRRATWRSPWAAGPFTVKQARGSPPGVDAPAHVPVAPPEAQDAAAGRGGFFDPSPPRTGARRTS